MWWIRTRAKIIIPVLLVIVAVVVAGFVLSSKSTSSGAAGAGDEASGIRVTTDKDGKIIVTGRDPAEVKLSLALPQNCAQIVVFMEDIVNLYPKSTDATDEARVHVTIMHRLAQDLCSMREYQKLSENNFNSWYGEVPTAPGASTATTAPAAGGVLPTDTSVEGPASSSTIPSDATSTTVTGG
jgi:hypothetical protein